MSTFEPIDTVASDPAATAWRRTARARQAQWREQHGWPMGGFTKKDGTFRPVVSRIDEQFARASGANFLSAATLAAVRHRLANKELHQTIDERRLYCDLLSSMPMCFNLFGSLWGDPGLASAAAHGWFPDVCPEDARVEVRFEWSPGRRDARWLGDRTAFDAAACVHVGTERRLIGIETKYHEYPAPDPQRKKGAPLPPIPPRYLEVAEGMFGGADWQTVVWGTPLGQIWRDHLLALACRQDFARVKYVLVTPAENAVWQRLAGEYLALLAPEVRPTFEYRSLESLLDTWSTHPDGEVFRRRYLGADERSVR